MHAMTARQFLLLVLLGCILAAVCVYAGSLLNPPALARWETQSREQAEFRAFWAMIGVRHLPIFLLSLVFGLCVFRMVACSSIAAGTLIAPYLLYAFAAAISESVESGESALSWIWYQPGYFIWPHFAFMPAGVIASYRMVQHRVAQTGAIDLENSQTDQLNDR
jgi:undecaprenyl pyrophosphate phosphatase UppP